jgi:hypothetical protein
MLAIPYTANPHLTVVLVRSNTSNKFLGRKGIDSLFNISYSLLRRSIAV